MNEPFRRCPRFQRCSCNRCPLDPRMLELEALPGEERCQLWRSIRERIAADFPTLLPWGGLWPREIAAKRRWESLAPAARDEARARMAAVRASRGGGGVLSKPISADVPQEG